MTSSCNVEDSDIILYNYSDDDMDAESQTMSQNGSEPISDPREIEISPGRTRRGTPYQKVLK